MHSSRACVSQHSSEGRSYSRSLSMPASRYYVCENSSPDLRQYGRGLIRFALELLEWFGIAPPIPSDQMECYEIQIQWLSVFLFWLVSMPLALVLLLHVYPLMQLVPGAFGFCMLLKSYDVWQRHLREEALELSKRRRFSWPPPSFQRKRKNHHHRWAPIWLYLAVASVCTMLTVLWRFYFPVACLLTCVSLILPATLACAVYRPL
eukprot:Protomagalhaensia_sp_Gyna_25__624@NODE_1293_length_1976_cov_21_683531_g1032_i0_p1_GENE_NODE_1293_length_1976_cov_21_683531_g1032_i0NODE_1293_length_1976_cov_21_683531_g1032_i0_p1_ORF_typecomplete_len206_score4_99DotU/PF09850_9/1_2e03DotU/PF09850_9/0_15DUF4870/PF09685_10/3_7e02DUF4870/PF09685_10/1_8LapA_dom/PF06305_11/1_4LapA_dom/PF06305_11/6_8e03DUF3040/PF11239_8/1_7e03DUF3040/PF11239_8/0_53_NODE_1293_length_1976_cov_21_683531_g1032_i07501367